MTESHKTYSQTIIDANNYFISKYFDPRMQNFTNVKPEIFEYLRYKTMRIHVKYPFKI